MSLHTSLDFTLLILPNVHAAVGIELLSEAQRSGWSGEIVRLSHAPVPAKEIRFWQPYREYTVDSRWGPVQATLFGLCLCLGPRVFLASGGIAISAHLVSSMLEAAKRQQANILIASRFASGGHPPYPFHRLILSHIFRAASRLAIARGVSDPRSGLKLFSRNHLLWVLRCIQGRSTDLHLLPLAYLRGTSIAEVPAPTEMGDIRFPLSFRVLMNAVVDLVSAIRLKT